MVGWSRSGSVVSGLANGFTPGSRFSGWTYVLVRAVLHDAGLNRLDALYETTTYPSDLLWGPGIWKDAAAWLQEEQPAEDEVEVLDRLFMVQCHGGRLYLPRSPGVAAGLTEKERQGTWYLVRSDFPADALAHARAAVSGQCSLDQGSCGQCAAEPVGTGTWQEMIDLAVSTGITITPQQRPDTKVPSIMGWPRYFEVSS
jgi:hypothetical protein